jgi:hypothetical protein
VAQKSQDRKPHRQSGSNGHHGSRSQHGPSHRPSHGQQSRGHSQQTALQRQGEESLQQAQAFVAPMARFNELSVRAFEQMARYGYEIAGDMLDLAIEQMRAAASSRDINTWVTRQTEITASFLDRQTQRTNELVRQSATQQEDFTEWASATVETAAEQARRGAEQRLQA